MGLEAISITPMFLADKLLVRTAYCNNYIQIIEINTNYKLNEKYRTIKSKKCTISFNVTSLSNDEGTHSLYKFFFMTGFAGIVALTPNVTKTPIQVPINTTKRIFLIMKTPPYQPF